ncbi:MAG: amidohydrolase family protein [Sphingomonadaceae bacterium]|uniref:N-acyl-D-amino-acid deacylase family protein n=1 Tax=Thermaurantiacus sp. TaxID=2820283 RepID=UPI00298EE04D|nr:amidohydrolase family protein [Thermaurantiacus sp.]MCS6986114.1 amidohydrolase family protein [Sphingomonadaceae bacterium]MDW8414670.1 amidohydrolase family protein [Thermaurantiacus sp.]
MLDCVIRGATVIDGTGAPARTADVGIQGDRIAEVGRISAPARRVIAAEGLWCTPGFIDLHTHYDGQASWDPWLAPTSLNGVTTIAMGNCGVGFAPARPDMHHTLIALLEGVEDIPGTALAEGLTWDWESFPDYLDALARRRFTMDVAVHLPHAALRCYVMGERGADHRERPTEAERAQMAHLTREALRAGALGFSTSRTLVHRSRDGAHIGTFMAGAEELLAIAGALRDEGKGVIQLISDAYLTPDDAFAERELALIEAMARVSGRPLSFTVQQADEAPDRFRHLLEAIARMVGQGLDVKGQVAPRPIGVVLGFQASVHPFLLCPSWRALMARPFAERITALAETDLQARLLAEHAAVNARDFARLVTKGFHRMFRMGEVVDYEPRPETSLAAEAARLGRDPAAHALEVLLEDEGRRLLYMPLVNFARGDLDDVHAMMTAPHTLYGLSDGGAHCGTICDASFPTTTLALWPRGNRSGRSIPVEELVRGLSWRNARHLGWADRGRIAPGLRADLNLIDPAALAVPAPRMVFDLPAGGGRLLQEPRGFVLTIVAGEVTHADGRPTGALPGRLIRA